MDKGRGSAPDYAIWMDAAEEQALREALHVAQAAQAEVDQQRGGGGRLLRDARKLHQVYGQLARLGFGKEDIEQCLPHMRSDSSLNDALDWACLHLPEASLPPSFRMATPDAEDGDKELDKSSLLKKIVSAPAVAKPEGRFLEAKKRAAAFAKKAAGGAALVRLVPKFETRVAKRRSAVEAEAKRAVRRKSWRAERQQAKRAPTSTNPSAEEEFAVDFGDGSSQDGGARDRTPPPGARGEQALASWLSEECGIGAPEATAFAAALAADGRTRSKRHLTGRALASLAASVPIGYDSTLALCEIEETDWPDMVPAHHRDIIKASAVAAGGIGGGGPGQAGEAEVEVAKRTAAERGAAERVQRGAADREAGSESNSAPAVASGGASGGGGKSKKRSGGSGKKKGGGGGGGNAAAQRAAMLAKYQTTSVAKPVVEKAAEREVSADVPEAAATAASPGPPPPSATDAAAGVDGVSCADDDVANGGTGRYDLSRWSGKTPKTMLLEWFQKMQAPRPKIELESVGRRYRAYVVVVGDTKLELPGDEVFDKREQAEQAAATAALYHLFGTGKEKQPLYRMLPPAYRTLWLGWVSNQQTAAAQLEADSAAAALIERERFVDRLEEEAEAAERQERREAREVETGSRLQAAHARWVEAAAGCASAAQRASLPISKLAEQLSTAMASTQVAVLCGETGSGKSTQVPQMLLEEALASGAGGTTSILCTQPRRIAATSLARRVASERGEQVGGRGSLVGYQVRLESKRTESTRLLYCTTGIALRMMLCEKPLEGISHVVVDEVHERDTQTDLLLLLLRELLPLRPDLRVVCMSATVQAELFSSYFGGCPVLTAQGRSYPVTDTFLEDILATTGHVLPPDSPCRVSDHGTWNKATFNLHRGGQASTQEWKEAGAATNPDYDEGRYAAYPPGVHAVLSQLNESAINHDLIMELVDYIDLNLGDGAVLVFLPGFADISTLYNTMSSSRRFGDRAAFRVLPLHSSLSPAEQSAVFDVMPTGVRKVVLATNIAETSITIDDAVFVIDSGRAKSAMFDERKQMRRLVDVWISQAEARQRAGRAGRVRAGHAFKLYTRQRYTQSMLPARVPEMLRGPLQELCLQLRLAPLLESYELRAAFARALDPPKAATVEAAIIALQRSNALDADEALTPLGRHLAALPVEICIGRLMLYGALFSCADPILLIAAALSDRSPFLQPLARRDEAKAAQVCFNRDESDHLAAVDAYQKWMHVKRTEGNGGAKRFCDRHFLAERALVGMGEAADQFWGNLADLGLLPELRRLGEADKQAARRSANRHADSPLLLKAVLAAGLFPNVLLVSPGRARPSLSQQKQSVSIHPSSFNHMASSFTTSYLVFHEKVKTSKIVVHDVTAVTALDLLLLGGEIKVLHAQHRVVIDNWIDLTISPRVAVLFKALRHQMMSLMRRRIADAGGARDGGHAPQAAVLEAVVEMVKRGTVAAEINPEAIKERAIAAREREQQAKPSGRGGGNTKPELGKGKGGGRGGRRQLGSLVYT
ncbi:hypothetical protein EMIHUDRAFT_448382 [Emiliania huxleyi CCMP1516]|uniref:RNA helicase n=2 Tax=Emiliania huxleyi TaxID=2903 RepID=A0A0D3IE02_EMIH1|nr:hypothetical protein EMIHUDRAFT_448382 [Emiliania huxleyi CCMP1516]EOD09487.1 hypothetical protein EMIHUDRAFT_448382 [Emiliania huxleyi CCMP1516]|eukprot:XP_005761916.1 hypothetical protein EMIHUDRAFT_448382 [Emiliania huxleyi CCMP1516]